MFARQQQAVFVTLLATISISILLSMSTTTTTRTTTLLNGHHYGLAEAAQQQQDYWSGGAYPISGLPNFRRERVSWCTTSLLERKKCLDWARAIEDVNVQFEGQEPFELNLDCVQGSDKDHCMGLTDDERADMILLDAGELGVAGRYHSLTPIMAERYASGFGGGGSNRAVGGGDIVEMGHYSVAVVKKRSNIQSLEDLFGRKACFSGVSHMASWILPLASLIDLPRFEIVDCNNLVKSASYFFGNSCAPNAMINKFNPTGDNPPKMSLLCERQNGRVGAHTEPYAGAFSALKCLAEPAGSSSYHDARGGDVAFLPHNTVFLSERLNLSRELRLTVPSRNELELLCPQGGRAPLDRWQTCNFGFAPAHAVMVSSRTSQERRAAIQRFLKTSVQLFSGHISSSSSSSSSFSSSSSSSGGSDPLLASSRQQQPPQQQQSQSSFDIGFSRPQSPFELPQQSPPSPPSFLGSAAINSNKILTSFKLNGDHSFMNYPALDVLFSSDMVDLVPLLGVGQTFKGYLNSFPVQAASSQKPSGAADYASPYYSIYQQRQRPASNEYSLYAIRDQIDYFEKLRQCPVPAAVLCVTSDREFAKCQAMSKAFHAAGLKPVLNCKLAQSSLACMQLIRNRDADLVALDAADIYIAGTKFGLIPIVAEQIEAYETSHYAIAVAKKSDRSTDLFTLKSKMTCHSGYLKGAGWVMPMHFLLSNDRIRKYDDCDSARSAAEHFDKSCAPGVLSSVSSTQNVTDWTIRNMCELCHGSGASYCARDASEPFYGDTGSFRCLVEGGGEVAFCKHTAIFENTGGSNRETWARNLIKSDFELLCRDGSRAPVSEYKSCNLGSVPSNAIVTRGDTALSLVEANVNLFMYGQQYYGSRYSEEYTFKMFSSTHGRDLIFQDATQQLVRVPIINQTYNSYLGYDFMRAVENMFCSS